MLKNKKILLASSNKGKIKEFKKIFNNFEVISQEDLGISDAVEDGMSFFENALKKARHASKESQLFTIADDSGIVVPELNFEPGIYSARYASIGATDEENINKLLGALKNRPSSERKAKFICSLVLIEDHDKQKVSYFNGEWKGEIANKKTGRHGFGYDPIFFVPSLKKTAAELSEEIKNKVSHRAIAINKLKNFLENQ